MIDQEHSAASDALTVARLATLPVGDYDRIRGDEADKLGWRVETLDSQVEQARRAARQVHAPDADRPPAFSDEALALRFTERHQAKLRYVAKWGRWLIREPAVWRFDETMQAFNMARVICREAATECTDQRIASAIASAKTVAAIERLARADPRHAATVEQWDVDPWVLNTPGGVVDLRIGELRPHRDGDYMTKITAVAPGAECPTWLRFLDRITGGDAELQDFLRRMSGYCLTGSTQTHALFFGFGTGANGKGTFVNTVAAIMGTYAAVAQMETFTASSGDRHPTDLAMLRGARLVTAQETEEGRRWAESKIKALTGGDPITARFMRQDFFTFTPQFKLLLIGNHKPELRNVDESIRRRFHLILFGVQIPPDERDPELFEKLKPEWGGILGWMIGGCVDWQTERLAPPAAVITATDEYLEAEDSMGQWITERCVVWGQVIDGYKATGNLYATTGQLFASWKDWAVAAEETVGTQKRFSQALVARKFKPRRQPGTGRAGFDGIKVLLRAV